MREVNFPESGSKRRLLDAAEQLFAEKGFEGVSVRDITKQAKTNIAAVNYHFGGREPLLEMVIMRYMVPITQERLVRLDALDKKWSGKVPPLEEIIEALVRPLMTQVKKSELSERLFYKLVGRIYSQQADQLPDCLEMMQKVFDRFMRTFAKALPTVDKEELAWRLSFTGGAMIYMMTHQEMLHRLTSGFSGSPTMEATISRFIRFAAAGMRDGLPPENLEPKKGPQGIFNF